MADDTQEFFVGHDVHQRREDADTAVGAGERVDVDDIVDLEIQRDAVGVGQSFGQPVEPERVGVVIGADRVVFVHPVDILLDVGGHLFVGQRGGLRYLGGAADCFFQIELRLCRHRGGQAQKRGRPFCKRIFHNVFLVLKSEYKSSYFPGICNSSSSLKRVVLSL